MKFKIYKGLSTNLERAPKIEGCWYITTDTQELYVCFDGVLHHINDASSFDPTEMQNDINNIKQDIADLETKVNQAHGSVTVKSYEELPDVGSADIVYIIEDENAIFLSKSRGVRPYITRIRSIHMSNINKRQRERSDQKLHSQQRKKNTYLE